MLNRPVLLSLSALFLCSLPLVSTSALAETVDAVALFAKAKADGQVGLARKTKPVDARAAQPGEIVVTMIKGEGVETRSKPAEMGDFVVRNRCPNTGNEEYLVKATKFAPRYADAGKSPDSQGWKEYLPKGKDVYFWIVPAARSGFDFVAPWGEAMVAKSGDALVQSMDDEKDTYRVAASSFGCTYEVIKTP